MKGVRFRLQTVLDYREQLVEQREQELAVLERRLHEERQALLRLRRRIADLADAIRAEQQSRSLNCEQLVAELAYLERLRQMEQEQLERIAQAAADVEAKRSEVLAAEQDRQVLDKLREKASARQMHELQRKESQQLDEIAVTRFRLNELGNGS